MAADLAEAEQRAAEAEARAARVAAAADPEQQAKIAKGLGGVARIICDLVAARRGAHWKLLSHEERAIGESGAEALGPWLAPYLEYAPLIIFAGVLYATIDDRVQIDNRIRAVGAAPVFDGPQPERHASSSPEPDAAAPSSGVDGNRITGPIR